MTFKPTRSWREISQSPTTGILLVLLLTSMASSCDRASLNVQLSADKRKEKLTEQGREKSEAPDLIYTNTGVLYYTEGASITPLAITNQGKAAVTCSSNPPLPAGLTISVVEGSCRITGTPTSEVDGASYTITATAADNSTGSAVIKLAVLSKNAPTITSVTPPADATYNVGEHIDFVINTSEAILVTTTGGLPSITLDIGGVTRQANYFSGHNSNALTFRYTVLASDLDLNGITATFPLNLNGGTLKNSAGSNLNPTVASPPNLSGVTVHVGIVASPVISPATGSFSGPQSVSITSATGSASIYYTTDGSIPDNTDTLYTTPFSVTTTTTVRAIAYRASYAVSNISSATLTISGGIADPFGDIPDRRAYFASLSSATELLVNGIYHIYTKAQLRDLHATKCTVAGGGAPCGYSYRLMADIDLTGEVGWAPIGDFSGDFDGNHKKIFNLNMISLSASVTDFGFFFQINTTGKVYDLTLENLTLTTDTDFAGALVGSCSSSIAAANIYNVKVLNSTLDSTGTNAGGFIGNNVSCKIYRSTADVDLSGGSNTAGGFAGSASGGTISASAAFGSIASASLYPGGFIGLIGGGTISNCYSTSNITVPGVPNPAGTFVGNVTGGTISYSYARGSTVNVNAEVKRLFHGDGNTYGANNFNLDPSQSACDTSIDGISKCPEAQMQLPSTFSTWALADSLDDRSLWYMDSVSGYPRLVYESSSCDTLAGLNLNTYSNIGDGPVHLPHLICRPQQLSHLSSQCGTGACATTIHYLLGGDIDMTSEGSFALINGFESSFDGNEHVIENLTGNGFMNAGDNGTLLIKNLGLVDANITTTSLGVGGLVSHRGLNANLHIRNSFVTGSITSSEGYVGGLLGSASGPVFTYIENSFFRGTINVSGMGKTGVGGLIGRHGFGLTLLDSFSDATINITNSHDGIGGLVGSRINADGDVAIIRRSYANNTIDVVGSFTLYNIGGLVGISADPLSIYESFANSQLTTGPSVNVSTFGGLVGGAYSNLSLYISDSYASGSYATGVSPIDVGGIIGSSLASDLLISRVYSALANLPTGFAGGFTGDTPGTSNFTHSFWDYETAALPNTADRAGGGDLVGVTGLTTAQMKDINTYTTAGANWNFTTIWSIGAGEYPKLRWQN